MFGKGMEFNPSGVEEFVPTGHMANTKEQFPDLDALDEPKKKQTKKQKRKAAKMITKTDEDEEIASLPHKGKPSDFFMLTPKEDGTALNPALNPYNYELGIQQVEFLLDNYPDHVSEPTCYEIMMWLFSCAQHYENLYSKPMQGGKAVDVEEEDADYNYDKGFGGMDQKDSKKKARQMEEMRKKMEDKRKDIYFKKTGKTEKTEAQKEEIKVAKAFKDKDISMNPEGCTDVDTTRQPCSIVFIGHVDAGKSTICGNMMYMMGVVDARTIQKYKEEAKEKGRDSWWLAYVMDVSDEEKAKGKTVEVGRATFDTK